MGSAGGSSTSRPSWTRAGGDYLGEGSIPGWFGSREEMLGAPGYFGDVNSQMIMNVMDLFGGVPDLVAAGQNAGQSIRQTLPGIMQAAIPASMQVMSGSQGNLGLLNDLFGQMSGYADAARQFAGGINAGGGYLDQAAGAAGQTLGNVMKPTAYNPMFQNAWENQMLPQLRASYAARGVAGGGSAIQGESEGMRDLSNDFAMRQFQEQIAAAQNLGDIGAARGNLGVAAAQVPGAVFNQFAQGLGTGQQAYGAAAQNLLSPFTVLDAGAGTFAKGLDIPFGAMQTGYDLTRMPLERFGAFLNAVPNIGSQKTHGMISSLFK